ncbi:soluble quino protein glucose/sorbosone dehydrogenase [Coniochaeta sp. 2T2.1]|nr:soluble quino protein glucose/sorbosone dehydrogenase [Coniochaeta sp. 2T2.1]
MKTNGVARVALAAGLLSTGAFAADAASACSSVLTPAYSPLPAIAKGWQAQLVAGGLKKPRSIQFDSAGALLIVDSGKGVLRYTFTDNGATCLTLDKQELLVNQTNLNHGLGLSTDGKTLYASSVESVFAWDYDAQAGKVSGEPRVVINNMSNNDLVTRTLLVSQKQPGYIVVSRGGTSDLDEATVLSSGLSQIRAFNLANLTSISKPYDFETSGRVLGWGLRNSVGVAEHPVTGGIYSVENSIDGVTRQGTDIHENNPGEELNFHGYLNATTDHQGGNYGYPRCFAVWDPNEIPDNAGLAVGTQFAMTENTTVTDELCASDYVSPRLTFPAHQAPLDIKFNPEGSEAYVSFHGSFDKTNPVGYSLSVVAFDPATGEPTADASSTTALSDVMTNPDHKVCPDKCFRPVGLAWDTKGRLWMSSDSTGEIFVLQKSNAQPSGTATASGTIVTATGSPSGSGAGSLWQGAGLCYAAALVAGGLLMAM